MNSAEAAGEKSQQSRVSKTAFLLMLMIVLSLAVLAAFANVQHFRHGDVEAVVIKPTTSPTPSARGR